jgi:hypothetical protein
VHFRNELSCEKDISDEYRNVIEILDQFNQDINRQIADLEKALAQIEKYQYDIQLLKQKLIQEEQILKHMSPETDSPDNIQVSLFCVLL